MATLPITLKPNHSRALAIGLLLVAVALVPLSAATIQDGTIRAMDLRQIKNGPDDFGLMTYDPAFMNTASCRSAITYLDAGSHQLKGKADPMPLWSVRAVVAARGGGQRRQRQYAVSRP